MFFQCHPSPSSSFFASMSERLSDPFSTFQHRSLGRRPPLLGPDLPPVLGSGLPPVLGSGLPPVLGSGLPSVGSTFKKQNRQFSGLVSRRSLGSVSRQFLGLVSRPSRRSHGHYSRKAAQPILESILPLILRSHIPIVCALSNSVESKPLIISIVNIRKSLTHC